MFRQLTIGVIDPKDIIKVNSNHDRTSCDQNDIRIFISRHSKSHCLNYRVNPITHKADGCGPKVALQLAVNWVVCLFNCIKNYSLHVHFVPLESDLLLAFFFIFWFKFFYDVIGTRNAFIDFEAEKASYEMRCVQEGEPHLAWWA